MEILLHFLQRQLWAAILLFSLSQIYELLTALYMLLTHYVSVIQVSNVKNTSYQSGIFELPKMISASYLSGIYKLLTSLYELCCIYIRL